MLLIPVLVRHRKNVTNRRAQERTHFMRGVGEQTEKHKRTRHVQFSREPILKRNKEEKNKYFQSNQEKTQKNGTNQNHKY